MDFSAISSVVATKMAESDHGSAKSDVVENKQAIEEFEALFTATLLSSMKKSVSPEKKSQAGGLQEDWTWNLLIQTISKEMAQSDSLGLETIIQDQIGNKDIENK